MGWRLSGRVFEEPDGPAGPDMVLEAARAFGPSVLQEDDGTLRMWYSGHDGSTPRILEAAQPPGRPWQRLGVSLDAGASGPSDSFGVESPSVVATPAGYVMAYAGSDGSDTRLHLASSADGRAWEPLGAFLERGHEDALGATHPSLLVTHERWWLFYTGYDGTGNGRRASILAAVSDTGEEWDRIGAVLEPGPGELAVYEPWVVEAQRRLAMFFVSDDDRRSTIQLATSENGVEWDRRGIVLPGSGEDIDTFGERSPCVARLRDGTVRMWFAGRPVSDMEAAYRLWSAEFTESDDWTIGR